MVDDSRMLFHVFITREIERVAGPQNEIKYIRQGFPRPGAILAGFRTARHDQIDKQDPTIHVGYLGGPNTFFFLFSS